MDINADSIQQLSWHVYDVVGQCYIPAFIMTMMNANWKPTTDTMEFSRRKHKECQDLFLYIITDLCSREDWHLCSSCKWAFAKKHETVLNGIVQSLINYSTWWKKTSTRWLSSACLLFVCLLWVVSCAEMKAERKVLTAIIWIFMTVNHNRCTVSEMKRRLNMFFPAHFSALFPWIMASKDIKPLKVEKLDFGERNVCLKKICCNLSLRAENVESRSASVSREDA